MAMLDTTASLKTGVSHIRFPSALSPQGAMLWCVLDQLEETQWWPAERIVAQQMGQLSALIHFANQTCPFYNRRLTDSHFDMEKPLTPERVREIPVLSRAELQNAGEAFFSTALPKDHGSVANIETSGSTGRPIKSRTTGWAQVVWDAMTVRDHLWHERDLSARHAAILHSQQQRAKRPDGLRYSSWGKSTAHLYETGTAYLLDSSMPVDAQLAWLQKVQPSYLMTFPSNLAELARLSLKDGVRIDSLDHVRTQGETVKPDHRAIVREAWGVDLYDVYSSEEVGYMALQAHEAEHYFVQSEAVYLEILDDAGEPCAPGEIGRVVVTTLHNFGAPLIRYHIGDYAEVGEPASCGRGLPVLNRVLGRIRNMLIRPDGSQAWPYFGGDNMLSIAPIRQFQIVQKTVHDIEARIIPEQPLSFEQQAALIKHISDCLGGDFRIKLKYVDDVEKGSRGKFEDFKSEVSAVA
ncbi:MAG: phenylacetate--CoA ligase family protein [Alphaproteobacteria bacterium]|nr:phenylacetate--CoA ligase family protein [Alphaproteobacteria bacterium]